MREMVAVDPEKIEWEPIGELPEGAWIKILSSDEETGEFSCLIKFDKGFREPKHTHPSDHDVLILKGELVGPEGNEMKEGVYLFAPAGEEHGPYDAPRGCIVFGHFNGPPF